MYLVLQYKGYGFLGVINFEMITDQRRHQYRIFDSLRRLRLPYQSQQATLLLTARNICVTL